ncbi:MAG: hypothetical protein ABI662_08440 [Dermatophilaceae bacterium]
MKVGDLVVSLGGVERGEESPAPIALAAVLMAIPWVHESKADGDTRYDVAGAVTATLGLITLVYGFTKAAPKGLLDTAHWTEPSTLFWFAASAILLTAFFVIENRQPGRVVPGLTHHWRRTLCEWRAR